MMFEVPLSSKILRSFGLIPKRWDSQFSLISLCFMFFLQLRIPSFVSLPFQILVAFQDSSYFKFQTTMLSQSPMFSVIFLPLISYVISCGHFNGTLIHYFIGYVSLFFLCSTVLHNISLTSPSRLRSFCRRDNGYASFECAMAFSSPLGTHQLF